MMFITPATNNGTINNVYAHDIGSGLAVHRSHPEAYQHSGDKWTVTDIETDAASQMAVRGGQLSRSHG
jgi:hypothetical protein